MIAEKQALAEAVKALVMKMGGGEVTRDDLGDCCEGLVRQACVINNALIDTLPPEHVDDGRMAFADMLSDLADMMRENGGKVRFDTE